MPSTEKENCLEVLGVCRQLNEKKNWKERYFLFSKKLDPPFINKGLSTIYRIVGKM